jgi:hypothetical protein
MSKWTVTRCDQCERTHPNEYPWLTVNGHGKALEFCSWPCVAAYATRQGSPTFVAVPALPDKRERV